MYNPDGLYEAEEQDKDPSWLDQRLLAASDWIDNSFTRMSQRREDRASRRREKAELAATADERAAMRARFEDSDSGSSHKDSSRGNRERKTPPQRGVHSGQRRFWAWFGDILITFGVVAALFVFWEVSWSNVQADRKQDDVSSHLDSLWDGSEGSAPVSLDGGLAGVGPGDPFARVYAPSLGDDFTRTVVQGTDQGALSTGPGHYVGSQDPGAKGNFALAGHRDGQGAPFHDIDKFSTCDAIVVETQDAWLTYRVLPSDVASSGDKSATEVYVERASECLDWRQAAELESAQYSGLDGVRVTSPDDVDVVAPVPGHPEVSADQASLKMLTLTTCHPIWSNAQRLIVHAVLADTDMKASHDADWRPEAL